MIIKLCLYLNYVTSDDRKEWFCVNDYKKIANEVNGQLKMIIIELEELFKFII